MQLTTDVNLVDLPCTDRHTIVAGNTTYLTARTRPHLNIQVLSILTRHTYTPNLVLVARTHFPTLTLTHLGVVHQVLA